MTRKRTYGQIEAQVRSVTAQELDDVICLTEHYLYASPQHCVPESVLEEMARLCKSRAGRREIDRRPWVNPILLAVVYRDAKL